MEKAKFAGEIVRRCTTEIRTDASGKWQLAVRQATVYLVEWLATAGDD